MRHTWWQMLVFLRTPQNTRAAPLTWTALASLKIRLIQSLLMNPARGVARGHLYVDDPLFSLVGTQKQRRRMAAIIILGWAVLGAPVAYHKAQLADSVQWIGVNLTATLKQVKATVVQDKRLEIQNMVASILSENVVAIKVLESFVGKVMDIALAFLTLRPFWGELYAAIHSHTPGVPPKCTWSRQVKPALLWINAFMKEGRGATRVWYVDRWFCPVPMWTITCDTSPWWFGAWLSKHGTPFLFPTTR